MNNIMSFTKHENVSALSSKLDELTKTFEEKISALEEKNKLLMEKYVALEKSYEKQHERLEVLEGGNVLLTEKLNGSISSKTSRVSKRKRVEVGQKKESSAAVDPVAHRTQSDKKKSRPGDNIAINNETETEQIEVTHKEYSGDGEEIEASFESLCHELLRKIVKFTGKQSYSVFGLINKQCNQVFTIYKIPKKTSMLFAPLSAIVDQYLKHTKEEHSSDQLHYNDYSDYYRWTIVIAVVKFNRTDVLNWVIQLGDRIILRMLLRKAIKEKGRFEIVKEVFRKSDIKQLTYLRSTQIILIYCAVCQGKLHVLKWLHSRGCLLTGKEKDLYHAATTIKPNAAIERWLLDNGVSIPSDDEESDEESDW